MIRLDNVKLKTNAAKDKISMSIEAKLTNILNSLKKRAEYEIKDNDFYRTINEHFINKDKNLCCKSVALSISQDEQRPAQHLLELSMLHPAMQIENKRPLAMGTKSDILKFLNDKNSVKTLLQDISQMSDKLSEI